MVDPEGIAQNLRNARRGAADGPSGMNSDHLRVLLPSFVDIVLRLVARTIAQMLALAVEEATSPFQYALSTKSGGECVAQAIQSLTDLDSRATVLSIDGISGPVGPTA